MVVQQDNLEEKRIREQLDEIKIFYEEGKRKVKCFCGKTLNASIVPHLKKNHPEEWEKWCIRFVDLRNEGLSYYRIIHKFKANDRLLFTTSVVEKDVQRIIEGKKAKLKVPCKKEIDRWQPENLVIGRETIWAFKKRGNWAVHQGDYRGNWTPEIPRFLINHYSKEEDIVIDPFVGGGTTLIETWLANRRGIGLDINPIGIAMSQARIEEMDEKARKDPSIFLRNELRPIVLEGDARNLRDHIHGLGIPDNSIKLVCAHPPYLNSLRYTATIGGDLSHISDPTEFCDQIQKIAKQIFDLLAKDGTCAVLIGDVRRNKKVIPTGFLVMERFLKENFELKNIIIKTQHNDSSTRFWYTKRKKIDFLLSHEYLLIFRKKK